MRLKIRRRRGEVKERAQDRVPKGTTFGARNHPVEMRSKIERAQDRVQKGTACWGAKSLGVEVR